MMPETSQYSAVSLFKTRPIVYKLGLFCLFCSFISFLIGFSSAYWIRYEYKEERYGSEHLDVDLQDTHYELYAGLWNAPCSSGAACNTGILVAQIAFSFHLAGYVISLLVAAYENCKKVDPLIYHSRVLELCVFVTGILGTAGMAVFMVWYSTSFYHTGFKWSLAVTSLSLTGIYITFLLLAVGNRKQFLSTRGTVLVPPQQGGVIYYNTGNACGTTVVHSQFGNQSHVQQTQPLLPQQPYFYPQVNNLGAPPAYSLPPAYPSLNSQPQSFAYPNYYEQQREGHAMASAPPYDSTVPQKS
uniref:Uncharacterized protein n=1 Tax=Arion vulgaris TaxID=1028688 RepID=A0A0B6Z129_9EUPU